jgi:hypothetical protein
VPVYKEGGDEGADLSLQYMQVYGTLAPILLSQRKNKLGIISMSSFCKIRQWGAKKDIEREI